MKNPPKELQLRQISETFGVAFPSHDKVILVQLEDGKAVDLVEVNLNELLQAATLVNDTLQRSHDIMKEEGLVKLN